MCLRIHPVHERTLTSTSLRKNMGPVTSSVRALTEGTITSYWGTQRPLFPCCSI
ncbi:hypothetical protein PISMIDRAFT_676132 [Pisolithus microcarpus 441]|uniref:Uncharacterized protein n=1 Tax=Pisolithus microcarpus 441 TaxID=765257 RepID=A0A0C9ZVS5_9AGAM|nr:hypothetical protein PISMIDRAFT_676132 [Pisolithus microcarpus 441]